MAGKIASKELGTGGCAFGHNFISVFTLTFFCLGVLSLAGCDEQQMSVTGAEQVPNIPQDVRKAEVLKSLDRRFENPQAHFELGQIYQAEGLVQKAEYHYNVALSFDPAAVEAQAAMVKLFLDNGNTAKAKKYADDYVNQASNLPIQSLRLAMAFQKEKLDDYALTCYQQALKSAPESARVNKEFGFYYLNKGDKAHAKEYFVRSFQLDPRQPEVANELGRLGVEVRIPKSPEEEAAGATAQSGRKDERQWRIVAKHGLMQVEPIVQKGEKKKNSKNSQNK